MTRTMSSFGGCAETDLYGHSAVHDALMDFCVRWSDGLDTITNDAGAIADALSRSTEAYRAIYDATARTSAGWRHP